MASTFHRNLVILFIFFVMLTHVHPKRLFRLLPVELGDEFVSNFDQFNQNAFKPGTSSNGDDDDEFEDVKPSWKQSKQKARRNFGGNVDFGEILPDKKDTAFAKTDGVVYYVSEDGNTQGQVSGGNFNYHESSESNVDLGADDIQERVKAYKKAKRPDYFKEGSDFGSSDSFKRFKVPKEHIKYVDDIPISKTIRFVDDAPEFLRF